LNADAAAQPCVRPIAIISTDCSSMNPPRRGSRRAVGFQASVDHADLHVHGGFYFGANRGELLPFSNPVSTAFCLQALDLWQQHQSGRWDFHLQQLI
jgi:hypothetical protein